MAYETLKNTEIEQQTIDTLEMAMWKSCILAGPENVQFDCDDYIFNKLKTELLSGLDRLQVVCSLIDEDEKKSVEILINKLLDLGKLDIALRISMMFNYNHKVSSILLFLQVYINIKKMIIKNYFIGFANIDAVFKLSRR